MEISRRGALTGTAAAMLAAHLPAWTAHAAAAQGGPLVSAFAPDRRSLETLRITAGGVERVTITAETLGNSPILQFLNRKATAVAVYSAPAGLTVAKRAIDPAAPELLFIIEGGATLTCEKGEALCGVGSLTLLEGGPVGEAAGPAGYTAIRVRLAP